MKHTLIFLLFVMSVFGQSGRLMMPSVFSNNMVLQQKTAVKLWGKAAPGAEVEVKPSWSAAAKISADDKGDWTAVLKTGKPGGPYEITVTAGTESLTFKNILFGEVWICSGQSNMEMPLAGWPPSDTIFNSKQEIAAADYSQIRLFTVAREFSIKKEYDCKGAWIECSPATAAGFSATAFFFGKKLSGELKVPVGLIHTSWGGTPAQAWTDAGYLDKYPNYKHVIDGFPELIAKVEAMNKWLQAQKIIQVTNTPEPRRWQNLDLNDADCPGAAYNDSAWQTMKLPSLWENAGLEGFDGVVWFRKTISVPDELRNKDLILQLGPIDDMDVTYVNGIKVGEVQEPGRWQEVRRYNVPKEVNSKASLTIACRVVDPQGGGGLYAKDGEMKLIPADEVDKSISIAGEWKYLPVAEYRNSTLYCWGADPAKYASRPAMTAMLSAHTPSSLYNAMIAPLVPYTIRGAIWYQGEANTDWPEEYTKLFPDMIASWRNAWSLGDFPFYFVQIAPWDYGERTHSEALRESQFKTSLAVKNTGMAVTLDVGNTKNIHPGNKQAVGSRLAAIALAKTYKKKVPYSGPVYKSMKIKDGKAVLAFDFADGLRVDKINGRTNFLIAGADKVFYDADVKIDGKQLIVSSPSVSKPEAVRYCWHNISEGTLFNKYDLPASTFRTDEWPLKK